MELRLDRELADKRIFPAVDVDPSGTRRRRSCSAARSWPIIWKLRRVLHGARLPAGARAAARPAAARPDQHRVPDADREDHPGWQQRLTPRRRHERGGRSRHFGDGAWAFVVPAARAAARLSVVLGLRRPGRRCPAGRRGRGRRARGSGLPLSPPPSSWPPCRGGFCCPCLLSLLLQRDGMVRAARGTRPDGSHLRRSGASRGGAAPDPLSWPAGTPSRA